MLKPLILSVAVAAFVAQAAEAPKAQDVISTSFKSVGLAVTAVQETALTGMLQVTTDQGLFYASEDGQYLMQGTLYDIKNKKNLTESALGEQRKVALSKFAGTEIEFKAKDEKFAVDVFTDITCGYCRKLHSQIQEYNDLGITVRYLAFPRGGLNSPGYNDMVSIWCAKDKQTALSDGKNGKDVKPESCASPVAEHYQFGQQVGVNGTPAIILPNGGMIPGYQPPAQLLAVLQQQ